MFPIILAFALYVTVAVAVPNKFNGLFEDVPTIDGRGPGDPECPLEDLEYPTSLSDDFLSFLRNSQEYALLIPKWTKYVAFGGRDNPGTAVTK